MVATGAGAGAGAGEAAGVFALVVLGAGAGEEVEDVGEALIGAGALAVGFVVAGLLVVAEGVDGAVCDVDAVGARGAEPLDEGATL